MAQSKQRHGRQGSDGIPQQRFTGSPTCVSDEKNVGNCCRKAQDLLIYHCKKINIEAGGNAASVRPSAVAGPPFARHLTMCAGTRSWLNGRASS